MKRYLILAASMSVLGIASAQAQVFPSPLNDNSAQITQTGSNNRATIDQADGGLALNGKGRAEIIQSRNNGNAAITQTNVTSAVAGGFDNTALIDQGRARDIATIDQIHDYASTAANVAKITQRSADAIASIKQRGDDNEALVSQINTSVAPVATIEQNGVGNLSRVFQRGANGLVVVRQGSYSDIDGYSGETQNSRVFVDNNGSNADIFVSQIGFGHFADINEAGTNGMITVSMEGVSNDAFVTQNSTNGEVTITSIAGSFANIATVTQDVSDTESTANVTQSGDRAESLIEQRNGVSGLGNLADVEQSGLGAVGSIYSSILQDGTSNVAFVTQAGAFALSDIIQTGAGHSANVSQ